MNRIKRVMKMAVNFILVFVSFVWGGAGDESKKKTRKKIQMKRTGGGGSNSHSPKRSKKKSLGRKGQVKKCAIEKEIFGVADKKYVRVKL